MNRFMNFLRCFLMILSVVFPLYSQEVRWEPQSGEIEFGRAQIRLVFEQCAPETKVDLPEVDGLKFGRFVQSSQTKMINFSVSRWVELIYTVEVSRLGKIVIPEFEVLTNKGPKQVAEVTYTSVDSTTSSGAGSGGGTTTRGQSDVVKSFLRYQPNIAWVGQVIDVVYEIFVSNRYPQKSVDRIEWKPPGLTMEPWSEMQQVENRFNGSPFAGGRVTARAMIDESFTPGQIPPVYQKLQINTGMGGLFSFPQVDEIQVKTPTNDIQVKPLPPAPAGFLKAVGQFKLTGKVVPLSVHVGEPITWTIQMEGTGNWPMGLSLPSREVSQDFRVIQPKSSQSAVGNKLFDATLTEDVVLIPEKEGSYTLPSVKLVYFDPSAGNYKTLQTEEVTVSVKPALHSSSTTPSRTSITDRSSFSQTSTSSSEGEITPSLPRDPFSGTSFGMKPFLNLSLLLGIGVLLFSMGFWVFKAIRHVPYTEPHRRRRQSLLQILTSIEQVATEPIEGIRAWRLAVIDFLEVRTAVPAANEIAEQMALWGGVPHEWRELWIESEKVLFSEQKTLDSQWISKAKAARLSLKIPSVQKWHFMKSENLFPLFLVCWLMGMTPSWGESFDELYRKGDIAQAHELAVQEVQKNPHNEWARSRLSLTYFQKQEPSKAYAHAFSAWLLSPRDEGLLWNLKVFAQKSGFAPHLHFFVHEDYRSPVVWFSVVEWQGIQIIGSLMLILGFYHYFRSRYSRGEISWSRWHQILMISGALFFLSSVGALWKYSALSNARALILVQETELKSIPTDLTDGVESKKIPAGQLATLQKEFLGWAKIRLTQGEEGWIRKPNGVLIYDQFRD